MFAVLRMMLRSFGTTFLILASDEPVISQDFITSYTAILWRSRNALLSSIVAGRSSSNIDAISFQNDSEDDNRKSMLPVISLKESFLKSEPLSFYHKQVL